MNRLSHKKDHSVILALGSNIGDAETIFQQACELLKKNSFVVEKVSSTIKTSPVDCPPGTPDFANGALQGRYSGSPDELLVLLQKIEQILGRPADHGYHESRTLDLDIILFDDLMIDMPHLTIPHVSAQQRFFVLKPLAEIAPDRCFPDSGLTAAAALQKLKKSLQAEM